MTDAVHTRACTGMKGGHNSATVQHGTHVYMNFFDHKDLGNQLLQLCPKVVKHPVYAGSVCLLSHDRFLPSPFQFIIHPPIGHYYCLLTDSVRK
jgi:hypothetical protein